jgi:hypothetical protein
MQTSKSWIAHFKANALRERVDWNIIPGITTGERCAVIPSLQAWQLGETSEGKNLIAASKKYAEQIGDKYYVDAVKLFIKEEQKHGNNLGRYLDSIGERRICKNWGDTLFRKIRYLRTSMETWTLAVIVVESIAQLFYQSLKDATECQLLKQICNDILIDEAYHITFQTERLATIFHTKTNAGKAFRKLFYKLFFFCTAVLVWFAHNRVFKAGRNTFSGYTKKMNRKYQKTINRITCEMAMQMA